MNEQTETARNEKAFVPLLSDTAAAFAVTDRLNPILYGTMETTAAQQAVVTLLWLIGNQPDTMKAADLAEDLIGQIFRYTPEYGHAQDAFLNKALESCLGEHLRPQSPAAPLSFASTADTESDAQACQRLADALATVIELKDHLPNDAQDLLWSLVEEIHSESNWMLNSQAARQALPPMLALSKVANQRRNKNTAEPTQPALAQAA